MTENWAAAAISGPQSRALVAEVVDIDVSNGAFPFLAAASCNVRTATGIVAARLFRMSYSGELAYEVEREQALLFRPYRRSRTVFQERTVLALPLDAPLFPRHKRENRSGRSRNLDHLINSRGPFQGVFNAAVLSR